MEVLHTGNNSSVTGNITSVTYNNTSNNSCAQVRTMNDMDMQRI